MNTDPVPVPANPRSRGGRMPTVELLPAFRWICPECGRDQYEDAIRAELTAEDRADMGAEDAGELLAAPEVVRCRQCALEFETENDEEAR